MMLLPLTWVSKYEQICLVEYVRLSLPSIGEKSPFDGHLVTQHFALKVKICHHPSKCEVCVSLSFLLVATCATDSLETNDLARAQSSLNKIIRQAMFVCLRTSSGFPNGKEAKY